MVNSPLLRPYLLGGGGIGGVPLDSHDICKLFLALHRVWALNARFQVRGGGSVVCHLYRDLSDM